MCWFMISWSSMTHSCHFLLPYCAVPRMILDTFNPEFPRRTSHWICSGSNDLQIQQNLEYSPYGTFLWDSGVAIIWSSRFEGYRRVCRNGSKAIARLQEPYIRVRVLYSSHNLTHQPSEQTEGLVSTEELTVSQLTRQGFRDRERFHNLMRMRLLYVIEFAVDHISQDCLF